MIQMLFNHHIYRYIDIWMKLNHDKKELLKIVLLPDLTHMMTPAGNSSYSSIKVMPIVYDTISTFIHKNHSFITTAASSTRTAASITIISVVLIELTSSIYRI